jgi:hypothetical protein
MHLSVIADLVREFNAVAFSAGESSAASAGAGRGGGGGGGVVASSAPAFATLVAATVGGAQVEVRCGEFARCAEGCALVNPSNSGLRHGGGLARAIDDAAGPAYVAGLAACRPLPVGTAKVTGAYALSAHGITHVIHTGKASAVQVTFVVFGTACVFA